MLFKKRHASILFDLKNKMMEICKANEIKQREMGIKHLSLN